MVCVSPLKAFYAHEVNSKSGKRSLVFDASRSWAFYDFLIDNGFDVSLFPSKKFVWFRHYRFRKAVSTCSLDSKYTVVVPCSSCIGCRLAYSQQWAIRCMHEASLHRDNCFVTLTFNDEFLNKDGSLVKRDFQLFMKRLRRRFGNGIRYYHCGEYGSQLSRPHHHVCLFGFDFPDKVHAFRTSQGIDYYNSPSLEELWSCPITNKSYGMSSIGAVTFQSVAYVARYMLKKVRGSDALEHYGIRLPEYSSMSRRPGLASEWFAKFSSDVYPGDFVVHKFKKFPPPKYYDHQLELTDPTLYAKIKADRRSAGELLSASPDHTPQRLATRGEVLTLRSKKLIRIYEDHDDN